MLKLVLTAKFRKDFKTIKRRGYDTELLEPVQYLFAHVLSSIFCR